jgi:carbon monoxide dehydrogenase subunit G
MEFKDEFVLHVPIRTAWGFMSDPLSFASCIPGYVAGTMQVIDDTHFQLTVKQSIARIPAKYEMNVEILEKSEPSRLVARIRGRDPLLGSNIDAKSVLLLSPTEDGSTAVSYWMELNVTGKVATFGYPVIVSKGKTFSREFVATLIQEITIIQESENNSAAAETAIISDSKGSGIDEFNDSEEENSISITKTAE